MSVTLAQLLTDSSDKVRNSTTGALDNNKRTRAANRVLQDLQDFADWDFTKRTKAFFFIDRVTDYNLKDYIGTTMQDNDGSTEISDFKNPYDLRLPENFHRPFAYRDIKEVRQAIRGRRNNNEYGIDGNLLVINYPDQVSVQLHNCDSLTANGNWAASGDATNLTIDQIIKSQGSGSLNFDTSAGTSLILTNPDFAVKDLEQLQNKSHLTMDVWLPSIANFSSIKVEWGDSASANWEKTETLPAGNSALVAGKNKFAFRWAEATQNGSPDVTSINYIRITITYSSAITDTDFRIDDIRIGEEVEMNLDYYSLAMVADEDGNRQLEFNPDAVTQTDVLAGPESRRTVVQGMIWDLFQIIGGKSARDITDAEKDYKRKKIDLRKRIGRRLRRGRITFNFPRRN